MLKEKARDINKQRCEDYFLWIQLLCPVKCVMPSRLIRAVLNKKDNKRILNIYLWEHLREKLQELNQHQCHYC